MKIYLAGERAATATDIDRLGGGAAVWTKHVKRRLFSFYYHGYSGANFEKDPKTGLSLAITDSIKFGWDLFLDSGAFTAFTKGVEIPLEEYAQYVKNNRKIWTVCSSLDAIGRGEYDSAEQLGFARQSWQYFDRLRHLGADVFPVWHVREPLSVLRHYVDAQYPYILIGGMVPETTQALRQRLDVAWGTILTHKDGTAKVKVHGFGLTDWILMRRYNWHSVDSTSWLMTGVFGACIFRVENKLRKIVFSEASPEARKDKGWHYFRRTPQERKIIDSWLEPYGVTAGQLSQHYTYRDVINAAVFQDLEDLGTDVFDDKQPILWDTIE